MPPTVPSRPEKFEVLHTFAAHIPLEAGVVFERMRVLLDPQVADGRGIWVDVPGRIIVAQGAWWYRAEYRVFDDDDARGASIEHLVLNVAQRGERAALVAGRRVIQSAPLAFHDLVKRLRSDPT